MKIVPFEKLQQNLDYYLLLCHKEDIYVVKDHKIVSRLVNPKKRAYENFKKLKGCFADKYDGTDYKEAIGEEILKRNGLSE